jgi:hypothetical protein
MFSRRDCFRLLAGGFAGMSCSGWLGSLAAAAAKDPERRRSCILLWMNGGPSQIDTFDLKPGHANGGPFKEVQTAASGIRICEHLPKVAKQMRHLAVIRSMATKEADHTRATYLMRTGRPPGGAIQYPALGAVVAKELDREDMELPGFVSIAPVRFFNAAAYDPGYLGPRFAPLIVGERENYFVVQAGPARQADDALNVQDLAPPEGVDGDRARAREELLELGEKDFLTQRGGSPAVSHRTAYERALKLMRSTAVRAFRLDEEKALLRDAYGRNLFGQGCLLARRLIEQGVPFVEVTLNGTQGANGVGWDTHQNNFDAVQELCGVLDPAWATLLDDLKTRGLLDTTTVVWMGEFGRTPKINEQKGRDHWANAWSVVLGGGGIKGGQLIGKTTADGMEVADRPVGTPDLLATVCRALGLDPMKQNPSNVGRPIRLVEPTAQPVKEVLA